MSSFKRLLETGTAILIMWFLPACINGFFTSSNVCYGDLGCFSLSAPFFSVHRPVNLLPESPEIIQTKFLLYTRGNPTSDKEENIGTVNGSLLPSQYFDGSKKTKLIVHGFTHNAHRQWVEDMIAALLKKEDMNVIAVDWSHGDGMPYRQATSNTRVVGAIIAKFLENLCSNGGTSVDMIHIIGHSLGAHIAGYAGERLKHIGRITGLDPAGPYFDGTDPVVSLDPTDADFVDVIHTDSESAGLLQLGFGSQSPMGHIDFFPNGGHHQPGCKSGLLVKGSATVWNEITLGYYAAEASVACSHMYAVYFFTESVNTPCEFKAYPCTGEKDFQSGSCLRCPHGDCSEMGYNADKFQARGSFYLDTQASKPYCSYHYQVNVTGSTNVDGIYSVVLHGSNGASAPVPLMSGNTVVKKNAIYSHLLVLPKNIGTLDRVTLKYDETSNVITEWLYPNTEKLLSISAFSGESGNFTRFCARGKTVTSHTTVNIPATC